MSCRITQGKWTRGRSGACGGTGTVGVGVQVWLLVDNALTSAVGRHSAVMCLTVEGSAD